MKALFFGLFLSLVTLPVYAEPLKVTYGLYASGFNVVEIEGTYDITPKTYNLTMDLKTAGMLGRLAPWAGVINSEGRNKGAAAMPQQHSFASTWRDDTETSAFTWDNDGRLIAHKVTKDDGEVKTEMPDVEIYADKPTDMLSAMFRAMNNPTCESTQPALDGKRRFDMVFRSKGEDMLEVNKYSSYQGMAEICEVEIVPVAGKWRDKPRGWMSIQEQAKGKGQLPRLWFGKVRDDLPPIPVKFFIKTNYGAMVMHLQSIN